MVRSNGEKESGYIGPRYKGCMGVMKQRGDTYHEALA